MKINFQKGNGLDAANDQPAKNLTKHPSDFNTSVLGTYPTRHNTVTADVIYRLLNGQKLTGMDAVFATSTTRLAAFIHRIECQYGWLTDHSDVNVGTNDGRVTVIRAYFLPRAVIRSAFEAGAAEFCQSVKAARAMTRKNASKAKKEAQKRNSGRSEAQLDLFRDSYLGSQYE